MNSKINKAESKLHRASEMMLMAMVILIPLGICWKLYDAYDLTKITLFYAGTIILMILWLTNIAFGWMGQNESSIRFSWMDIPVLGFVLVYGASLFVSWDFKISFWGQYRSYVFGWFPLLFGALLYWIIVQVYSEELENKVIAAAICAGAAASVYGILQYFGFEFKGLQSNAGGRIWSSFGNPLYFGSYCMMLIPFAAHRLIQNMEGASTKKWGWYLTLILLVIGLILSLSRSAWVGLGVGMVVYVLLTIKGKPESAVIVQSIKHPFVIVILAFVAAIIILFAPARKRFKEIFVPAGADYARIEGWKQGINIVRENPILGTGADTFVYSFRKHRTLEYIRATGSEVTHAHAHNDILQYASTSGILGLGAYLWVWITIFTLGWKQGNGDKSAILASLAALFVNDQFNFWTPSTMMLFWIFLGLLSGRIAKTAALPSDIKENVVRFKLLILGFSFLVGFLILRLTLKPAMADAHFMKGQGYLAVQNYELGVQEMEDAIAGTRRIETYYEQLANVFKYLAQMDYAKDVRDLLLNNALEVSKEAVIMLPKNPDCHNNKGVVLMWMSQMLGQDRRSEAESSFKKAIEMDPNFVDAWANLARVAHFKGDVDSEMIYWKKVLEIEPQNPTALRLLSMVEKQKLEIKMKEK